MGRSIESIFAELAAAGLVRQQGSSACSVVDDYLGGARLAHAAAAPGAAETASSAKPKTGGKKANAAAAAAKADASGKSKADASGGSSDAQPPYPEPSMAQARQAVVASCILPLGGFEALRRCVCRAVCAGGSAPVELFPPRPS